MFKFVAAAVVSSIMTTGCASSPARDLVRIDATSIETANSSYKSMKQGRPLGEQQKLALAMLMLNLEGVENAYEVACDTELQSPSAGRIKDKISGLTADEIIRLADHLPSALRIEVVPDLR